MHPKRALPRFVTGLLCVVIVLTLVAAAAPPALAQGNPPLWYRFRVGSVDPDEKTSYVGVVLRDQANCQGGFQVYTAEEWNYWGMPAMGDPMGRSTDIGYDMHMWSGQLVPGAYYVRLGSGARPGCVVGVSGNAVYDVAAIDRGWRSMTKDSAPVNEPAPAVASIPVAASRSAPATNPAPVADRAPAAPAIASARAGTSHHDMEMVPNHWMPVTDNEPMMFEFQVGHVRDDDTSSVSVALHSAPFRTGRFEIFTAEGKPFYLPEHNDWFGTGESVDGRYATWHGDLVPGAYYVLVYPEGMRDCMLSVSGQSIKF